MMSDFRLHTFRSTLNHLLLGGLVFTFGLMLTGCGLLGGGDDGNDEKYPEPPGRPESQAVIQDEFDQFQDTAFALTQGPSVTGDHLER